MTTLSRRSSFLLFAGDVAAFVLSLYVTLVLRYLAFPTAAVLAPYFVPFAFLFAFWALVFYGAGLYSKQLALFPSRLPDALLKTQFTNILLAAVFFFLVPAFGITPKTILALYLVVSLAFILLWRLALYSKLSAHPHQERSVLIAEGEEANELFTEVNGNPRYGIAFCCRPDDSMLQSAEAFLSTLKEKRVTLIVADPLSPTTARVMPLIYTLTRVQREYQFAAFEDFYEEVFDRIPLSQLGHAWFLENVAPANSTFYTVAKRTVDMLGGLLMGALTLAVIPFVWLALRIEGPGPLFIKQERFGERGGMMYAYKFRSMRYSDGGAWKGEGENYITKVGAILRKTSLDEFPQFINILRGELSLIGPRNDIKALGERLGEALPYYETRYLVTPGITGWAQINQRYEPGNVSPQSVEETKVRLAYDFYYLKHRSFGLDMVIALKTVKRMFFRVSSW